MMTEGPFIELPSCPKCGEQRRIYISFEDGKAVFIGCETCGASAPGMAVIGHVKRAGVPGWMRAEITQAGLINLQRELRELRRALSQVDPWILGDSGCVCQFCGKPMTYCDQPKPETDHDSRCVWLRAVIATREPG